MYSANQWVVQVPVQKCSMLLFVKAKFRFIGAASKQHSHQMNTQKRYRLACGCFTVDSGSTCVDSVSSPAAWFAAQRRKK